MPMMRAGIRRRNAKRLSIFTANGGFGSFLRREHTRHDAILHDHLHSLKSSRVGNSRRCCTALEDRRAKATPRAPAPAQDVRRRRLLLDGKINPDAADGRHAVRRVADAVEAGPAPVGSATTSTPQQLHCRSRSSISSTQWRKAAPPSRSCRRTRRGLRAQRSRRRRWRSPTRIARYRRGESMTKIRSAAICRAWMANHPCPFDSLIHSASMGAPKNSVSRRRAARAPSGRVPPVAADHEIGAELKLPLFGVGDHTGNAAVPLDEAGGLPPPG